MKTLSVVLIHCFNYLLALTGLALLLVLLVIPGVSLADGSPGYTLTDEDKAIAEMAEKIRQEGLDWSIPLNEHEAEASLQASRLLESLEDGGRLPGQTAMTERPEKGRRVLFFASYSLGEAGLMDLMRAAAVTPDAAVVFRGIQNEEDFIGSITAMQALATTQSPMANVILDPTLFRDHGIDKVPTIVYLDREGDEQQREVARVSGLADPRWLLAEVEAGISGDMGVRGPVEPIAERDLIEVLKERMAAIDWEQKKEAAVQRFWERQQFIELARAPVARRRYLDPTVVVTADIEDADGGVLVPAGTRINPLEMMPFSQAVVIFDPLDERQLSLVDEQLPDLTARYSRITLIVTRLDRADGWASYESVTDHFDAPVFKLTPDIRSRFDLEFVPSVVTAEHTYFVIDELADPAEDEEENNNAIDNAYHDNVSFNEEDTP